MNYSLSSEDAQKSINTSEDSEFDEILGGNRRRNRKVHANQLDSTEEDTDDEENNDCEPKKKRKSNKNSFLIDECDSDTDDEDESTENEENEYDLEDSLIDKNEYSHNGQH